MSRKGAEHAGGVGESSGAAPWESDSDQKGIRPEGAKETATRATADSNSLSPFQGLVAASLINPRALPWAGFLDSFGVCRSPRLQDTP